MIQMQSEENHHQHINRGDPPNAKAGDEICVDVLPSRGVDTRVRVSRIDLPRREMQDVKNDEYKQQHTSPPHRARRPRRHLGLALLVADWPRGARAYRQLPGYEHVQYD